MGASDRSETPAGARFRRAGTFSRQEIGIRTKIRYKTNMNNTVAGAVLRRRKGWTEVKGPVGEDETYDWDLFWGDINCFIAESGFQHGKLLEAQKINHFPRNYELCRKDLMAKNLKRMKRQAERQGDAEAWNFFPVTYTLPIDWGLFVEDYKQTGGVWIAKPVGRAQGKGIFLVNKISQLMQWKKGTQRRQEDDVELYVVQRYIERPLLVGGRKFDLRLYCLVTSFRPLTAYLHRAGFARCSSDTYKLSAGTLGDVEKHLTNHAITKHSENYVSETGNKWSVSSFRLWVVSMYGEERANQVFFEIQGVVVKSLQACQDMIVQDRHCFELYGYDIMVDQDLKPWLLEVNAQPSLSTDTTQDRELKMTVVSDVLDILDLEFTRGDNPAPLAMGGFDSVVVDDAVQRQHPKLGSMLGCAYPSYSTTRSSEASWGDGPA